MPSGNSLHRVDANKSYLALGFAFRKSRKSCFAVDEQDQFSSPQRIPEPVDRRDGRKELKNVDLAGRGALRAQSPLSPAC